MTVMLPVPFDRSNQVVLTVDGSDREPVFERRLQQDYAMVQLDAKDDCRSFEIELTSNCVA